MKIFVCRLSRKEFDIRLNKVNSSTTLRGLGAVITSNINPEDSNEYLVYAKAMDDRCVWTAKGFVFGILYGTVKQQ